MSDDPLVTEKPRYYWDHPLQGTFDLEAVQAQIRTMSDEEVARAVLAIRMGPQGSTASGEGREKSPAAKAAEKTKRAGQRELLAAARAYMLAQAQVGGGEGPPDPVLPVNAEIPSDEECGDGDLPPNHYPQTTYEEEV